MTGWISPFALGRISLIMAAMTLVGCESTTSAIQNVISGPTLPPAPPEPEPDENGVITFPDIRVMMAREGDTIASMAARANVEELVLARFNGLPTNYLLRAGERLALPDSAQVFAVEQGWTPEVVTGVLDDLPNSPSSAEAPQNAPGTLPIRHRVEPGETAFSIAKLYGVSVTALASWNGLDGELTVTPGRSLIIPAGQRTATVISDPVPVAPAPQTEVQQETVAAVPVAAPTPAPAPAPAATPAPAPAPAPQPERNTSASVSQPGGSSTIVAPPSAAQPLPENPVAAPVLSGPDTSNDQPRTVNAGEKMSQPVVGRVIRPYSAAPGRSKNDGIDYATEKGAIVRAAASGEVALVSPSIGLGQIVLIRHRDNIISVYGRLSPQISVKKGQRVNKGDVIGTVADGNPPTFHFEVRRGTEAVDPTPFL